MKLILIAALVVHYSWELFLSLRNNAFIRANDGRLNEVLPPDLRDHISPEDYRRAVAYSSAKTAFGLIQSAFSLILVVVAIAWALLNPIDQWLAALPLGRVWFLLAILLILQIVGLPFDLYRTFVLEKRFGFNKTTPKIFLLDQCKSLFLSLLILTPLLWLLLLLYDVTGPTWWVWGFLLFSAFQFLMLILYPLVIAPLFNTFVPLEDAALLEGIRALTDRVKFPLKGVFVMDGSKRSGHSNAYFTGIGKSKRIVFFDTLVDKLTHSELLTVLAHELGHFKLNHVKLQLLISLGLSGVGFYALSRMLASDAFFAGLGYATPSIHVGIVLLMMLLSPVEMVIAPLFNLLSRRHEYAADAFALDATEDRGSLATALIKLNKDNLSVPLVHPLYSFVHHSHPPLAERLLALGQ